MRSKNALVLIGIMAVCVATIIVFRVVRNVGVIPASVAAASLPVFTSTCVGSPICYPLPRHPIVVFGDSLTEGYGARLNCQPLELRSILPAAAHRVHSHDTPYPGYLARLLHRSVLNYGVGGELTSDGLPRLRPLVDRVHPLTVVILEGTNDLWGGTSPLEIAGNLSQMAAAVRTSGGRPILVTVLPIDRPVFSDAQSKVDALNVAIRVMAKRRGVTVVDGAAQFRNHYPLSTLFRHSDGREDSVHPNDAGYQALAVAVSQSLQRL